VRWIGRARWAHAVFRRTCLVNTPLFAGFPGFRNKLWLADPDTDVYRSLYERDGAAAAEEYATRLAAVLALVAVRGRSATGSGPAPTGANTSVAPARCRRADGPQVCARPSARKPAPKATSVTTSSSTYSASSHPGARPQLREHVVQRDPRHQHVVHLRAQPGQAQAAAAADVNDGVAGTQRERPDQLVAPGLEEPGVLRVYRGPLRVGGQGGAIGGRSHLGTVAPAAPGDERTTSLVRDAERPGPADEGR
jgi:hypothetical protein